MIYLKKKYQTKLNVKELTRNIEILIRNIEDGLIYDVEPLEQNFLLLKEYISDNKEAEIEYHKFIKKLKKTKNPVYKSLLLRTNSK